MATYSGGDWQNVAVAFCSETWPNFYCMGSGEGPLGGLGRSMYVCMYVCIYVCMYVHKVCECVLPVLGTAILTEYESRSRGLYRARVNSPN